MNISQNQTLINNNTNNSMVMMNQNQSFSFISLLLLFLSFIFPSSSSSSSTSSTYTYFLQCIQPKTQDPTSSISSILLPPSSFAFVPTLDAYARNLRFVSNITSTQPLLITTPTTKPQVSAIILCARASNTMIKIRSGGHDYEGVSYTSYDHKPFIILDTFQLKSVQVNAAKATAYVEAGATLGELYYAIWKQSGTLGFPAGVCPTVGVGGHFSGGGYGNLLRKYGLSVDHIVDAEIVDVNGRVLDRKGMGEDLFWAIRGGGGASFGVIVSYTVTLVAVPEKVTVFNVLRFINGSATDLVYKWQTLMQDIDHNLFMRLLLQPIRDTVTKNLTGRVTFIAEYLGSSDQLVALMSSEFPELGIQPSDCQEMSWAESTLFWDNYDVGTPLEVLLNRTYNGGYLKRKSDYVQQPISKPDLELLWQKLIQLGKPGLVFNSYGGIMKEIASNSTAFPHRAGNLFKIQYSITWHQAGKAADSQNIALIRELHSFMTPYVSKNPRGAYLNYRDLDIGVNHKGTFAEGKVFGQKYFIGNFDRLVKVKTAVDPQNFFRNEQSIPVLSS